MRQLQRYSIPALGILILAGIWYVRSVPPHAAGPTAGDHIIAFGDSLVTGRGASPDNDLVSVLGQRLGVRIINAGRSGDTTASALLRLDRDVLSRSPRVVMVLLGGNDFLRRVPREETFRNLATIVDRIRQKGAAVVVVGVSVGLIGDSYASGYEQVARSASAGLVPGILGGIIGDTALMSDAIHPNDKGYRIMAERLVPVIQGLIRSD